jgi:hypothetical protein
MGDMVRFQRFVHHSRAAGSRDGLCRAANRRSERKKARDFMAIASADVCPFVTAVAGRLEHEVPVHPHSLAAVQINAWPAFWRWLPDFSERERFGQTARFGSLKKFRVGH